MALKRRAIETDPTGRFVRYSNYLGKRRAKSVYMGFDKQEGKEVAWSIDKSGTINCDEAKLLQSLNHENILKCHHSWFDPDRRCSNMITEYCCSGNLEEYSKNNHFQGRTAVKNWCSQILQALNYLHACQRPIIHRDVKCEHVFVNGNTGLIKLGDFDHALYEESEGVLMNYEGTKPFMAPEVSCTDYDHKVDIYSFGITVLQMVIGTDQVLKRKRISDSTYKLTRDEKNLLQDSQIRNFISKCLKPSHSRSSAYDLLFDPFLESVSTNPNVPPPITVGSSTPNVSEITAAVREMGGTEQEEEDV